MAIIVAASGGGNWTAGATWVGGVAPTSADDAQLGSSSGNVTVDSGAVCRSLDCTGYTGTLTHTAAVTLNIGDGTAGASNIALKFVSGMSYTLGNITTSAIAFVSTSSGQQTIDPGGKTTGNLSFAGAGSDYVVVSALSNSGPSSITHSLGTVHYDGPSDASGLSHTTGVFNANFSSVKTINLGACSLAIVGTSTALALNATGTTWPANTAVITMSAVNTITCNTIDLDGTSLVLSGSGRPIFGTAGATITMANFTVTGTTSRVDALFLNADVVCSGTATLTGNSKTSRLLVQSGTVGTLRTITAATVVSNACDFQDMNGAGAGNWNLSGASNYTGDCGGNTGITATTAAMQTSTGTGSFTWSNAAIWTSRVPLPQDDVVVSNAFTGTPTITMDMPRMGRSIDFSGGSGSQPTMTATVNSSIFGSLTLRSGGSYFNGNLAFEGRGNFTLTTNGVTMPSGNLQLLAPGGKLTQQDDLTWSGGANWLVQSGEWDTNGFDITSTNATGACDHSGTGIVTIASSTVSFAYTGSGSFWIISASNILNATGSVIILAAPSVHNRTFSGGLFNYGELRYDVADSPGALIFSAAAHFEKLTIGSGRTLTLPSARTNTVDEWLGSGENNGFLALPGVNDNSAYTPSSAALQITGAITIDAKIAPVSWTPSLNNCIAAKYDAVDDFSYLFYIEASTGRLVFGTSPTGATAAELGVGSSIATGFTDGSAHWVRASFQPDDGAGNRVTKFYTSSDGATWTQLGSTFTHAGTTSIFSGNQNFEMGSYLSSRLTLNGGLYNIRVYAAYLEASSGTPVLDADFTTKPFGADSFVESSTNAATISINGILAQVGDGRLSLNASVATSAATLVQNKGIISGDYLVVQDIKAATAVPAYAGSHGVLVSNATNWYAQDPPASLNGGFFACLP